MPDTLTPTTTARGLTFGPDSPLLAEAEELCLQLMTVICAVQAVPPGGSLTLTHAQAGICAAAFAAAAEDAGLGELAACTGDRP